MDELTPTGVTERDRGRGDFETLLVLEESVWAESEGRLLRWDVEVYLQHVASTNFFRQFEHG